MRKLENKELLCVNAGLSSQTIALLPLTMGVLAGLSSSVFGGYTASTSVLVTGFEIPPIEAALMGATAWGYVGFYAGTLFGGLLALSILVMP